MQAAGWLSLARPTQTTHGDSNLAKPKQLNLDTRADSGSCLPPLTIPLPLTPADTFPWPGKLSSVSLNLLLPYVVLRYENKYLATQTAAASCMCLCVWGFWVCEWCRCLCLNLNFLRPYFMRLPMRTFKILYYIFCFFGIFPFEFFHFFCSFLFRCCAQLLSSRGSKFCFFLTFGSPWSRYNSHSRQCHSPVSCPTPSWSCCCCAWPRF